MSLQTTCPGCRRPLRVPDDLIGRDVKCPACATIWTVAAADAATDSIRETPATSAPPREQHIREIPDSLPAGPQRRRAEADEGDDDVEEERFERERDERMRYRRGRKLVQEAGKRLQGPAIGLLVCGILRLLYVALNLVATMAGFAIAVVPGKAKAEDFFSSAFGIIFCLAWAAIGGITLYGALQMIKVKNYSWSLASCIVSLLPCWDCCFFISAPFAIWGIVVMAQPDVKRAFAKRPRVHDTFRDHDEDDDEPPQSSK